MQSEIKVNECGNFSLRCCRLYVNLFMHHLIEQFCAINKSEKMLPVVNAQKPNKQKLNHATKSFPQLKDVLKGVRAVNVVRYCLEVNDCCFM